jgi:hypothetical protein
MPIGAQPFWSAAGFLGGWFLWGGGIVRQWMAAPGVHVNAGATSRQWMAPAGTYVN